MPDTATLQDTTRTIRSISIRAVNAPMKRPVRTAMGAVASAPLVLIDVDAGDGVVGRAYIFAYTPDALGALARLLVDIRAGLVGKPLAPADRYRDFDRRFRLLGWEGLVGMAVSGLDMALWDALARAQGLPLVRLLGGTPRALPAYDSFGTVDPAADGAALAQSVEQGFRAIKIKIGDGDLARDIAAVAGVRKIIGPAVRLMVDYNQSLDPPEALRRLARLAEFDIEWVEEPVPHEDLAGHAKVRAASPVRVQTGENWWFPSGVTAAIAAGASDFAMLDVMKIGGVTGWLRAAALAEAASLPVSSHLFVEASAHLLPVTPTAHWLEYLDIGSAILAEPLPVIGGKVTARGPGMGLDWDEAAVKRYAVS
jgi:mandelate racemase